MGTLLAAGKRSEGGKCNYLQLAEGTRKKYIEKKCCREKMLQHCIPFCNRKTAKKKLRFGIAEGENSEPLYQSQPSIEATLKYHKKH